MTYAAPNSIQARDIASLVHPQTNLARHLEQGPVVISRGEGIYVWDDSGQQFLDAAAGLWCASLGYASERLARVAYEQMKKLGYAHLYRHTTNEPGVDLAEKLLQIAPVKMSKVLFQCSGSEANDTAIKLVWYYHAAIGKPEKRKIIGRKMGYHGSTSAAISASGKPDMHADFGLPFPDFRHTEYPHYYRLHEDGETEEQFATRMADALEAMIVAEGPETVGGFIAEPVMGAGGGLTPPRSYWEKIQAVLRKYDVLFIADEVICGFGRTGNWFGCETYGFQPDSMSLAKALSSAYIPISAVLLSPETTQAVEDEARRLGTLGHGFTYSAHPVASAVALKTIEIYERRDIVGHVRRLAPLFARRFARLKDHPLVGDAESVGLIGGIELVAGKAAKASFARDARVGLACARFCEQEGLIVRPLLNDRIAICPPLVITEAEVNELFDRFERGLGKTLEWTKTQKLV